MARQADPPLNEEQVICAKSFRQGLKITVAQHGVGDLFFFQKLAYTACQGETVLHQAAGSGINVDDNHSGTVRGEVMLPHNHPACLGTLVPGNLFQGLAAGIITVAQNHYRVII